MSASRGNSGYFGYLGGGICVLAAAAIGGSLAGSYARKQVREADEPPAVRLAVAAADLNLGDVWETVAFVRSVHIKNTGNAPIHIRRFSSSCACSGVEPSSVRIPAGGSRRVRVTLDLTRFGGQAEDSGLRPFDIFLSPVLDSGEAEPRRFGWSLHGRVKTALAVAAPLIDLGSHSELDGELPSRSLSVQALTPLASLRAKCDNAAFAASISSAAVAGRYTLTLRAVEKPRLGFIATGVTLEAETATGERLPVTRLPVQGAIVRDVQPSCPEVVFLPAPVGRMHEEVVTLESLTGRAFRVVSMRTEGAGVTAEVVAASAQGIRPEVLIRQRVERRQDQTTKVLIQVRDDAGHEYTVVVPVRYCGLASDAG